jgi:hypothetical protein
MSSQALAQSHLPQMISRQCRVPSTRMRATLPLPARIAAPRRSRDVTSTCRASASAVPPVDPPPTPVSVDAPGGLVGWWRQQQARSAELRKKLGSLGMAAVLAYG